MSHSLLDLNFGQSYLIGFEMFLRLYMDSQIVPVYDSMGFVAHYSSNFALTSI